MIPSNFLTKDDRLSGTVNPTYEEWEDQILLSCLQSSFSKTILSWVPRVIHSYQVWEHIHDYFFTQAKARERQLRTDLYAQSHDNKSMREFLGQIKTIVDELAGSIVQSNPMNMWMLFLKVFHKTMPLLFVLLKINLKHL